MASPPTDPTASGPARAAALALLGLPPTATGPDIVHAYRRLVRATHPDATGSTHPAATEQFAAIHDAYQLLAQPVVNPAEDPADAPVAEPVEPVEPAPQGFGDEPAASPQAPPPPTPMWVRAFRSPPPIVAGPVMVTPPPEQHRPHRRRPR